MSSVGGRLAVFTLAMLAVGGALAYPAGLWGGAPGQWSLLAAWLLSAIPGWLILSLQGLIKSPQQGVFLALGSTTGRLLFVGFGTLAVLGQQVLPQQQFAVWVIVCYLAALGIETGLMLRGAKVAGGSPLESLSLLLAPGGR